ncbi:MAG: hypothetical protein KC940_00335 [Candidatus Omnitrophica bacterium]|nr:hypothetical protein [Candidatus Omnitrophota bacterium]
MNSKPETKVAFTSSPTIEIVRLVLHRKFDHTSLEILESLQSLLGQDF